MERLKKNEIYMERFIQVPLEFFKDPKYADLSSNAKLMFGLIKDRVWLSEKNGWINKEGDIFLYFTQKKMETLLGIAHCTCSKTMKELEDHELIERVRQGLGLPDIIYVGKIVPSQMTSRSTKNKLQEYGIHISDVQKTNTKYTEVIQKEEEDKEKSYPQELSSFSSSLDFFMENFHKPGPFEEKKITALVEKYGEEIVTKAMEEAALKGVLTMKYVEAILKNWEKNGGDKNPNSPKTSNQHPEWWTPEKQARDVEEIKKQMKELGIPEYPDEKSGIKEKMTEVSKNEKRERYQDNRSGNAKKARATKESPERNPFPECGTDNR